MISGIVFDKDGTLFDFQATWAEWVGELCRDLAGGDADLRSAIERALGFDAAAGRILPGSVVVGGTPAEVGEALLRVLPATADRRALVDRINASAANVRQVEAVPLLPLMEDLRARGLALACVTNDAEEVAREHLRRAGIETRFDVILGYDSGHGAKPDPAPLRAAAALCGLRPADLVMVGDGPHDLQAGRAAGMRTVAVTTGVLDEAVLAPLADAVLPNVGNLSRWLGV